jgi:hypothetical protein
MPKVHNLNGVIGMIIPREGIWVTRLNHEPSQSRLSKSPTLEPSQSRQSKSSTLEPAQSRQSKSSTLEPSQSRQ